MRPGNVEFVDVLCSMTVWTGGVAAVLAADVRHLSGLRSEALARAWARAWLPATFTATVLGAFLFGVFYAGPGLLIHFVRTRRSLLGLGLGLCAPIGLVALDLGVQTAAEAVIGWLGI